MKTIAVQTMTEKNFARYGRFASLTAPEGVAIGDAPIRFYRDMLPLGSGQNLFASVTTVEPMPLIVDVMEYHTTTREGFLCLDTDAYIAVAPATPDGTLSPDDIEAFFLPKGTMVYLHAGVWHYAPFPAGDTTLHSLVILPERTYANQCEKLALAPEDQVELSR